MSYIKIQASRLSDSGKTLIYNVWTADLKFLLGKIKWHGQWRKYAFHPDPRTLYEEVCLREIATFIEDTTIAHRIKQRVEKKKAASL